MGSLPSPRRGRESKARTMVLTDNRACEKERISEKNLRARSRTDHQPKSLLAVKVNNEPNKNMKPAIDQTVGEYLAQHDLSPDGGYDAVNDEQVIEAIYRTRKGDEMIVFGMGCGRIIVPISGGGSVFDRGEIEDYLVLENNSDWIKQ